MSLVQLKDYYDVFYVNARDGITKENVDAAKQKYATTMSLQRIAGPLGEWALEQLGLCTACPQMLFFTRPLAHICKPVFARDVHRMQLLSNLFVIFN